MADFSKRFEAWKKKKTQEKASANAFSSWDDRFEQWKQGHNAETAQADLAYIDQATRELSGEMDLDSTAAELKALASDAKQRLQRVDDNDIWASDEADAAAEEMRGTLSEYEKLYGSITDGTYDRYLLGKAEEKRLEREQLERARMEKMSWSWLDDSKRFDSSTVDPEYLEKAAELEAAENELNKQAAKVSKQQRLSRYQSILDAKDYSTYSKADETHVGLTGSGSKYAYINDLGTSRTLRDAARGVTRYGAGSIMTGAEDLSIYRQMTEDEVGIYNYLYAVEGEESAEEYLDSLDDLLRSRAGQQIADTLPEDGILGVLGKGAVAGISGVDSFTGGLRQLFDNREAEKSTPIQVASGIIREDLSEGGKMAFDATQSIAQMLPSVMLSTATGGMAGPIMGAISQGASATGNAYKSALEQGADTDSAEAYALLTGASEATLQYLIGGIGKLGGKAVGALSGKTAANLSAKITSIDNALLRILAQIGQGTLTLGKSMISEGLEEGAQEFISAGLGAVLLDEEISDDLLSDALYSAMLGSMIGGVFEAVPSYAEAFRNPETGFQAEISSDPDYLGEGGIDYFDGISDSALLKQKYNQLVKENHPDVGGDAAALSQISKQYAMRKAFFHSLEAAESEREANKGSSGNSATPTTNGAQARNTPLLAALRGGRNSDQQVTGRLDPSAREDVSRAVRESRDAALSFYKTSGREGKSFEETAAILAKEGNSNLSTSEAYKAWAQGVNERGKVDSKAADVPAQTISKTETVDPAQDTNVPTKAVTGKIQADEAVTSLFADLPPHKITREIHTKTGADMWVLRFDKRLNGEQYQAAKKALTEAGGYYSRFANGFVFTKDPAGQVSVTVEVEPSVREAIPETGSRTASEGISSQDARETPLGTYDPRKGRYPVHDARIESLIRQMETAYRTAGEKAAADGTTIEDFEKGSAMPKRSEVSEYIREKLNRAWVDGYFSEPNSGGDRVRITEGMSDAERYEILKDRTITLGKANAENVNRAIAENPSLADPKLKKTDAKKLIRQIAEEFGSYATYQNEDFNIEFEFSRGNLSESLNKQKGSYDRYVQMLSCFSDVISNAVGIEVHNKNSIGYKPDSTLKHMYVLSSAFEANDTIVPVKLEIKEFSNKPNHLYVAVALESVKKDRVVSIVDPQIYRERGYASPVTISIADLFANVNPRDGDFLKYIPDGFLSAEQIASKRAALEADKKRSEANKSSNSSREGDEENVAERASEARVKGVDSASPHNALAEKLQSRIANVLSGKAQPFNSSVLFADADKAFGGTQGEGRYSVKDAYDALELAVNRTVLQMAQDGALSNGTQENAEAFLAKLEKLVEVLPTQTKRSEEQITYQQFSTPPSIAYLAARAASITDADHVLEPSAGIGGLAVFPKAWGAEVTVNELPKRRAEILSQLPFDAVFTENAEQIDNVLPDSVNPSVVLMNPPFSSSATRGGKNATKNATLHIEQALSRLSDGGRLVAVLGHGMADDAPAFRSWWSDLRKQYTIRANVGIDGGNYRKYGTTFDIQLVVIDKVGAQKGETLTGNYKSLTDVLAVLEDIRNARNDKSGTISRASVGSRTVASRTAAPAPSESAGSRRSVERTGDGGLRSLQTAGESGVRTERADQEGLSESTALRRGARGEDAAIGDQASIHGVQREGDVQGVNGAVQPVSVDPVQQGESSAGSKSARGRSVKKKPTDDDGVYAVYQTPELTVKGAKKHPADLVESSAMATVPMPKLTYKPNLPHELITSGKISDAQLTAVSYAGQSFSQTLPDGRRKGFFIGDGTGVGKGREISATILDNMRSTGQKKAVWVSKNIDLFSDAQRDFGDIGGDRKQLFKFSSIKAGQEIPNESGILFSSYDTIASVAKDGKSRLDALVKWLGKDFDGVIAFDEAHNMGNLLGKRSKRGMTKPAAKAIAADKLQKALPNARVLYVSATAASDIEGMAFADRIGLWGRGTAFTTVQDFVQKIGASGISAMELVARDMKSTGSYVARAISYKGVKYDTVQHTMNAPQRVIYDTMARAWQVTLQHLNEALELTRGNLNANAKGAARAAYYTGAQRFFNQLLTSMSMPSVIASMKKDLAAGRSCVLQIVNTNEAQQERAIGEAKKNGEEIDLESLDLTPREMLVDYFMKGFPTAQYEPYVDEEGRKLSRLVMDSQGKPVQNRQAIRIRDAMIAEINEMSVPDGPLEMLFDAFGTENVAEITGRKRRVVPITKPDGSVERVIQSRTKNSTAAEADEFQEGKRRILVFSDAGGTGKSYHASLAAKNQQQRVHYVLQPGWNAANALQGLGRTHRSNEASAPIYKLVTTDVMGQKRFVSTIARRLEQLGALTKGQRQTGSGLFAAKDNLESDIATDSLREFYRRVLNGSAEADVTALRKIGLEEDFIDRETGQYKLDETKARDINKYLNRILMLEIDEQNSAFGEFSAIMDEAYEQAMESGTLDQGIENVKADKIEIADERVIRTDPLSGATTDYIEATIYKKPAVLGTVDEAMRFRDKFKGLYRSNKTGAVFAVYQVADKTDERGRVKKQVRLQSPNRRISRSWLMDTLERDAVALPRAEWPSAWAEELAKVPEFDEETVHMLAGSLLPVWDMLPSGEGVRTRVMRLTADNGQSYLGRVISEGEIDAILRRFDTTRNKPVYTAEQVYNAVLRDGATVTLDKDRLKLIPSRVSGERRIELVGVNLWYYRREFPAIFSETIQYQTRYFIPSNDAGKQVVESLIGTAPVLSVVKGKSEVQFRKAEDPDASREADWKTTVSKDAEMAKSISEIIAELTREFGLTYTAGHVNGSGNLGQYDSSQGSVRTKIANDLPTFCHELGHALDRKYDMTKGIDKVMIQELIAPLPKNTSGKRAEGFAEYLRKYLQNPETTPIDYPAFTAHFLNALNDSDLKRIHSAARDVSQYYAKSADSAANVFRSVSEKDSSTFREKFKDWNAMFREKFKDWNAMFRYLFVDSNEGIRRFAEEVGHPEVYRMVQNAAYNANRAYYALSGSLYSMDGRTVLGEGLTKILGKIPGYNSKRAKEVRSAFSEYLVVRHGPFWLDKGMRVFANDLQNSTMWLNKRQAELEARYPDFKAAAEELYAYQRKFNREWLAKSGLVTDELLDNLEKEYPFYVPLQRKFDRKGAAGAKRGFANQTNTVRRAKGSGLDIINPVESIAFNTVRRIAAAERNAVMLAITDIAELTEGNAAIIERIPDEKAYTMINIKGEKQAFLESLKGESSLDEEGVEKIFGLLDEQFDDLLIRSKEGKPHGDVVTVLRNGKPEYWKVNDPLMLKSLLAMDKANQKTFLDGLGKLSKFITGNLTGLNTVFATTNSFRDFQTAMVHLGFTEDKIKGKRLRLLGGIGASYLNTVRSNFGKDDALHRQYMAMGGASSSAYTADVNMAKRVMPSSRIGEIFRQYNPIALIEALNDMIERGPREGYFRILVKNGITPAEAFYQAQQITTNFRAGGVYAKQINNIVPFFNATVQGINREFEHFMAKDIPRGKRAKVVAGRLMQFATGSAMMAALTSLLNGYDEDDRENYARLSTYTKNNYWCIPLGEGKYLTLKKPQLLGWLATGMERTVEAVVFDNEDAFHDFYGYTMDSFLPTILSGIMQADLNTIAQSQGVASIISAVWANKDYLGRPIVPSNLEDKEAKDQYDAETSQYAYWLGQAFGWSPMKTDYVLKQIFGGFQTIGSALLPMDESERDITMGFAGSYVKDALYSTDVVNFMYDHRDAAMRAYNSDPEDYEKASLYKRYSALGQFYSRYYSLAAEEGDSAFSRQTRETVLDFVSLQDKKLSAGSYEGVELDLMEFSEEIGSTDYYPAAMDTVIRAVDEDDPKEKVEISLDAEEYVKFQKLYEDYYWDYMEAVFDGDYDSDEELEMAVDIAREQALADAQTDMMDEVGGGILKNTGYSEVRESGVSIEDYAQVYNFYREAESDKNAHGKTISGSKVTKVLDYIDEQELSDKQTEALYRAFCSDATADKYDKVDDTGVSFEMFARCYVYDQTAQGEKDKNGKTISGSKREKVTKYINSQSLTRTQKDAIYLALGYAESTLDEAPWN